VRPWPGRAAGCGDACLADGPFRRRCGCTFRNSQQGLTQGMATQGDASHDGRHLGTRPEIAHRRGYRTPVEAAGYSQIREMTAGKIMTYRPTEAGRKFPSSLTALARSKSFHKATEIAGAAPSTSPAPTLNNEWAPPPRGGGHPFRDVSLSQYVCDFSRFVFGQFHDRITQVLGRTLSETFRWFIGASSTLSSRTSMPIHAGDGPLT